MKRIRVLLAMLVPIAVLVAGCSVQPTGEGSDGASGELTPMTLLTAQSAPAISTEVAVYAVPKALGYFEEEGLDVSVATADGSTAAIQALAAGSGDVSYPEGSAVISAVAKGVPVKAFAKVVEQWQWFMGVLPDSDIKSVSDLKGKKIGVISLASGSFLYAKAAMRAVGLDPEKDVEIIAVGFGAPSAQALANKEVDAVALYTTLFTILEGAGSEFRFLDNPPVFDQLTGLTFTSSAQKIADDPDALTRYARAAYKGIIYTLLYPEEAVKIAYEIWPDLKPADADAAAQLKQDVLALQTEVGSFVSDADDPSSWGDWGAVSKGDLQALVDYAVNAELIDKAIGVEEFWDGSLIDGINKMDTAAIIESLK